MEIKYRLIFIFVAITTSMLTLIKYKYYLINLILETCPPLHETTTKYFILTSITELFDVFFNTSLFITYHITYYFTCYHVICFMSLGLYKKEYISLRHLFINSLYLWVACVYLFLQTILPLASIFFLEFKQKSNCDHLKLYLEPKLDTYLNFTISIYMQCCLIFQLILIFIFLTNYTKTINFIIKFKKTVYIGILITATIITPPDIWCQITVFLFLTLSIEIYLMKKEFNKNLFLIKKLKIKQMKKTYRNNTPKIEKYKGDFSW